jgi:hypothetical protein
MYRRALETDPRHSSARAGIIWALLAAGETDAARGELARFRTEPSDGDRYALKIADLEHFLGEESNAVRHALEAATEPEERYWPRGILASTLIGALQWTEAPERAEKALRQSEEVDAERLRSGDEGYMPHIDLAAVSAIRRDEAGCFRAMRSAVAAGWFYPTLADRDPLFASVRGEPEWASIFPSGTRPAGERARNAPNET